MSGTGEVHAEAERSVEEIFGFDPSYGFDQAALLRVKPPAVFDGFEAFWRATYAEARNRPPEPRIGPQEDERGGYRIHPVHFRSGDGLALGGWIAFPLHEEPRYAVVQGHGYGGRKDPGEFGGAPSIRLLPCTRGFGRSAAADLPNQSPTHVVHGLASRETYILRGCAMDLWASIGVLEEVLSRDSLKLPIVYSGRSFGGGIGALATPWDDRLARVYIGQPTFGDYDFRLSVESRGSNAAVRAWVKEHPEAREVLRYFDAAISAAFLSVPTLVSCSLFDPSVPPPGQFAIYNAIRAPKELVVELKGHVDYPEKHQVLAHVNERVERWFDAVACR